MDVGVLVGYADGDVAEGCAEGDVAEGKEGGRGCWVRCVS